MYEPMIGEIRIFGFDYPPYGWLACDGSVYRAQEYQALATVLGTRFGGDGKTTFGVPDLRGRAAMHWGGVIHVGDHVGVETVTLSAAELPQHTHVLHGASVGSAAAQKTAVPTKVAMFGQSNQGRAYTSSPNSPTPFSPKAMSAIGASAPHSNVQPRLAMLFCIAFIGDYMPRP